MSSWANIPPFAAQQLTSVSRFDALLDNIITLASHNHTTGCPGNGASVIGLNALGSNPFHVVPGLEQPMVPFMPDGNTCWGTVAACADWRNGGALKTNPNAAGDLLATACAVWTVLLHTRGVGSSSPLVYFVGLGNASSGCIAACIGGSPLLFGGASRFNLFSTNSGCMWDIASDFLAASTASGPYQLRVKVIGQDVSSIGWQAGICHIVTGFN